MKKIYWKLVITYLTIFTVIIVLSNLLFSSFWTNYYLNSSQDKLVMAGRKANQLVSDYYNNILTKSELLYSINSMSYISNTKIYVLNPDSTILSRANTDSDSIYFNKFDILKSVSDILNGKTVSGIETINEPSNSSVLYVGMPIIYNNEIDGIILLFTPLNDINYVINSINMRFFIISLIAISLGLVIILLISRRISNPIINLSRLAVSVATGEEVADVEITSHDEIATLSRSFNYMKNEIVKTEKIRNEMIANISHELRTPLTSIIGFIKGILDKVIKPEDEEKYLNLAYSECQRLKALTTGVLELAKYESGTITLNKTEFNIFELIQELLMQYDKEIKDKNITVSNQIPKNTVICADRDKIKQVFINLISNAIKYNRSNGDIVLKGFIDDSTYTLEVSDTGIGITEQDLQFIFDRFYRVKQTKNLIGGTGIGLSIVQKIIELHNGKINVTSKVDVGTNFIISLSK